MYIFVYICICAYRKKGIYVYMLLLLSCYIMCYSFAIPLTVACQSSLSVEFSRQEHQSGLPFPSLGDLPDPGIELVSVCISCIAGRFFTHWVSWEAPYIYTYTTIHIWSICIFPSGYYKILSIIPCVIGPCCLSILHIVLCIY